MTDRGDNDMSARMQALDRIDAPDQWGDILARAGAGPDVVRLFPTSHHDARPRRVWRIAAAAVAAVALVGTGIVVGRTTGGPTRRISASPDAQHQGPWRLGPLTGVPGSEAGAQPLVAAAGGRAFAAFLGQHSMVTVDEGGARLTVGLDGGVEALGSAVDHVGTPFAVALLENGGLRRVGADGRVSRLAELGRSTVSPKSVVVARDQVFVSGTGIASLVAVDLASAPPTVKAIKGVSPTALATSNGVVWALDESHDTLTRIDASSRRVSATLGARGAISIAATPAGVFLVRPTNQQLSFVGTGLRVGDVAEIDPSASAIAVTDTNVWVSAYGVFSALGIQNAKAVAAVGQLAPGDAALASDGTSVWELAGYDGLRRLVTPS